MLNYNANTVNKLLTSGEFGIEKESLRILSDGRFSKTKHPFPNDKHIVRDFCENQIEINTGISTCAIKAVKELECYEKNIRKILSTLSEREYLWCFSNPPFIESEEDIPIAVFEGELGYKTEYRNYLASVYGRKKMTFCGIHVNYSFSDELLRADFELSGEKDFREYKNKLYLSLAANSLENGWIINVLFSASPLVDSSLYNEGKTGGALFYGDASVRCGKSGYWNNFVPILDYTDLSAYTESVKKYISDGAISSASELYYPIRIKPKGENDLDRLKNEGANHIELRNIDLNPFSFAGITAEDLTFLQLFLIYNACLPTNEFTEEKQFAAVQRFKDSARYDIDATKISVDNETKSLRVAASELLSRMGDFFENIDPSLTKITDLQKQKIAKPGNRYAERVFNTFSDNFVKKGLEYCIARDKA